MRILCSLVFACSMACSGSPAMPPADGGVVADGGIVADGGVLVDGGGGADGGGADGGAADGGVLAGPVTWCELPGTVEGATVPAGFCIRRFATVRTPRVLAFGPGGDLFVASPSQSTPGGAPAGVGGIYVLPDDNQDGVADSTELYLSGSAYATVHGLLITGGRFFYTLGRGVFGVPYIAGERTPPSGAAHSQYADLSDPGAADRFTHTLAVDNLGQLYVSRGQYDNSVCPPPNPRGGSVLRFGFGHDAHGDVVVAGLRNPMYVNCAPWGCFASEMTGDGWDGLGGSEKLIELRDGDVYGYPCCVDHNLPVPTVRPVPDCSGVAVAAQSYPLHDSPFGFDWDLQRNFPEPYKGGLFMAFHGAVSTWLGTGLRFLPTDPTTHRPTGAPTNFVGGWSHAGPVVGRIADVRFSPDGRLFFADDQAGGVYWVAPTTLRRPGR